VSLVKGGRGDFIVKAGGQVVWDKKKMGDEFPDERVVIDALRGLP
jgi:predicted Rdx family selenoprotein